MTQRLVFSVVECESGVVRGDGTAGRVCTNTHVRPLLLWDGDGREKGSRLGIKSLVHTIRFTIPRSLSSSTVDYSEDIFNQVGG